MLIDIHTHASDTVDLYRFEGRRYPSSAELVAKLDEEGIDKAVLLAIVSPECRYVFVTPEDVMEMTAKYPDRLIPFCCADPRMVSNSVESDFRPLLSYYKEAGCKGIGEYIPNLPFDHPLNMNFFAAAEDVGGLPIIFHIATTHNHQGQYGCYDELGLPRLEKVLQSFPGLIFIGHSQPFWSHLGIDVTEETANTYPSGKVTPGRVVELMRRYPNLHGDLSAGSGNNAIVRDFEFSAAFLEEFQDRLYWGSDIAILNQHIMQTETFAKIKSEKLIPPEAYEKITWKNAAKLLRLEL